MPNYEFTSGVATWNYELQAGSATSCQFHQIFRFWARVRGEEVVVLYTYIYLDFLNTHIYQPLSVTTHIDFGPANLETVGPLG